MVISFFFYCGCLLFSNTMSVHANVLFHHHLGLGGFQGVSSFTFLSKKNSAGSKNREEHSQKEKLTKKKWWDDWTTVLPLMNWWRIISDLKWVRYFIFYFSVKKTFRFSFFDDDLRRRIKNTDFESLDFTTKTNSVTTKTFFIWIQ